MATLKTRYCDAYILKSLCSLRLQISEVLQDTQDNMLDDKRIRCAEVDAIITVVLDNTQLRSKLMNFLGNVD